MKYNKQKKKRGKFSGIIRERENHEEVRKNLFVSGREEQK